jgi:hypothetical protein
MNSISDDEKKLLEVYRSIAIKDNKKDLLLYARTIFDVEQNIIKQYGLSATPESPKDGGKRPA